MKEQKNIDDILVKYLNENHVLEYIYIVSYQCHLIDFIFSYTDNGPFYESKIE